jgi:hypothetical protein
MTECTDSSLEDLVESLVEGMVEVHTVDPELSELLGSEVPHRADGTVDFSIRFHEAFRTALSPTRQALARKSISTPGPLSWPTWSTPWVTRLCFAGPAVCPWLGQKQNPARRFLPILPPDMPLVAL